MQFFSRRGCATLIVSAVLLCTAAMPGSLAAQKAAGGSITGTVTDPGGRALQKVPVVARNEATHYEQAATSGDQGNFTVTHLPAGTYDVTITAAGFATMTRKGIQISDGQSQNIPVQLAIGSAATSVEVQAIAGDSVAAQHALSQSSLDSESAQSFISKEFIKNFTPATTDFSELINIAPGTISYNPNGVGLGQGTMYFRGFVDGDYNITWDGIPFNDSNNPTHHSWSFFPGPWIGGMDFDRSPGSASTIGQATYGGSINLLSPEVPGVQSIQPQVSYGSFNTLLVDGQYNTGMLGPRQNIGLAVDVHHMTSDGFQTLNSISRNAGDIKVLYRLSDSTTITGYSGVVHLFGNAPNVSAYRAQINGYGWNYLMENNDPTSAFYQAYNTNTVPTDFEYGAIRSLLKHGWLVDVTPYTYSYNNRQLYANDSSNDTTGLATGPNGTSGFITEANCNVAQYNASGTKDPCGIDKLNSYRKYGATSTISQTSRFGVFRTGIWYEWATSNRFQIPSDPISGQDDALPNFHENYWTNSVNPFAEFEWHATKKLSITGGYKFAYYNLSFKQFADNGKVVGNLGGAPFVTSGSASGANLPSAQANYHLTSNWSVYGQFGKGDMIPPTADFDVTGGGQKVAGFPTPQLATTYQGGTVVKTSRLTVDADFFRVKFQNNYNQDIDNQVGTPNFGLQVYSLGPDSYTQGFEAEVNASLGYGLNLYTNGTVGKANYTGTGVPSGLNVADTPGYTQGLGLTYQAHGYDLGVIEKRVGSYYDDNGTYHNQAYVAPYNNVNLFLNYTLHKSSFFDQSKISFSINNLFNNENFTDIFPFNSPTAVNGSAYIATTAPSPLDQINLSSGRSFVVTFKVGMFPGHHE
ncbi:MAG TPA: TonB-dependent receptor [Terracidiphilus sp.]